MSGFRFQKKIEVQLIGSTVESGKSRCQISDVRCQEIKRKEQRVFSHCSIFFLAAIPILLCDLLMHFQRICPSPKPEIHKLVSLQTE